MGTPLKILYVIGGGEFGGAEQHLLGLATALDPERWQPHVAVFYEGEFADRLRAAQVPVTVLAPTHLGALGGLLPLRQLLRHLQPDIIHTHGVRANLMGRMANRLEGSRARLVTTVHSVLALDYPVAWKRWIFERLEQWTTPSVDRFILVSHAMEQDFLQKGIAQKRITVVHNAIDLPAVRQMRPQISKLRQELGLPESTVIVGTVARLHPVKGHTYLLQAISRLTARYPDVHYVWIGGGEMRQELQDAIRQAGLTTVIHMLGVRKDVAEILPQLDIFVLPSLSEGLSLAIMEAMSARLPIITTAVGGTPEVLENGDTGILVPPKDSHALADAIAAALQNLPAYRIMGERAQERVYAYFTVARLLEDTVQVYEELVKKHKKT